MKSRIELWILFLVLAAMVIPFLILTFYTVPAADDYYFSTQARQLDILHYLRHFYERYTGRVFPTALFFFNPLSSGFVNLYFIIPLISILTFYLAIYSIVPVFWPLQGNKLKHVLISLGIFALLMQRLPSTAEGFYWVSGILFYTVPLSLFLFFVRTLQELISAPGKLPLISAFAYILSFLLPLSNEVIIIPSAGIILCIYFWKSVREPLGKKLQYISILFSMGLMISVLAPGNAARMNDFNIGHDLFGSILISFTHVGKLMAYQLQNPALLLAIILLVPLSKALFDVPGIFSKIAGLNSIIIIIASILVLWAMYFPSQYLTGYVPWRIHNTADIIFYMSLYLIIASIGKHLKISAIPTWILRLMIIASILLMSTDFQWKGRSTEIQYRGNIPLAWSDLLSKAKPYKSEWNHRISESESSQDQDLQFEALESVPTTIHFIGLKSDPQNDLNKWFSDFYGLNSVVVEPNSPE